MKSSKSFLVFLLFFVFILQLFPQPKLIKPRSKPPKLIISPTLGYSYVVGSANGDVGNFSMGSAGNGNGIFNPPDYGMQHGGGLAVQIKNAINKKRSWYLTGALGYDLFYNTRDGGKYRTKWSIFNIAPGIEYDHRSAPKNRVFFALQTQYSLIFGAWQTNVTFPDNSISNIYVKINPASRIGLSLSSGMEIKTGKKTAYVIGIKGVWANLFPKTSNTTSSGYVTSINDSRDSNGINLGLNKEIIYLQIFTGVNFSIR